MSNPEEKVDIVERNGTVISQTTKGEAHVNGMLHPVIIAEVINSKGEMALVKQAGDRQDPGQYVSPVGGHIGAGESEEDALKREAFEELGLQNFEYKFVGRRVFDRKVIGRHENHLFCVYEIYTDDDFVLNHGSVSYKYFSKDELKKVLRKHPDTIGGASHFVIQQFYPELLE